MTVNVAVVGASGRLGAVVCDLVRASDDYALVAELDSRSDPSAMLDAEVVVDVTAPGATGRVVDFAVQHGKNVLVGTSGWSNERVVSLATRLASTPDVGVVIIPNFSVGSVLATSFAAMAARFFESIEIVEMHHASKVDSPSGTAVRTAELIGAARSDLGPVVAPHTDQRARGQQVSSIPIHSVRLNGVVAQQDVVFGGTGEVLTLRHQTLSSSSYEAGILLALRAAVSARGVTVGLEKLIDLGQGGRG